MLVQLANALYRIIPSVIVYTNSHVGDSHDSDAKHLLKITHDLSSFAWLYNFVYWDKDEATKAAAKSIGAIKSMT